jgi:hypothetical protein
MGGEPIRLGKVKKYRGNVSGGVAALVIVLGVFACLSCRLSTGLRPDLPASFLEMRRKGDERRGTIEERAARAY